VQVAAASAAQSFVCMTNGRSSAFHLDPSAAGMRSAEHLQSGLGKVNSRWDFWNVKVSLPCVDRTAMARRIKLRHLDCITCAFETPHCAENLTSVPEPSLNRARICVRAERIRSRGLSPSSPARTERAQAFYSQRVLLTGSIAGRMELTLTRRTPDAETLPASCPGRSFLL
jgi:hypothetical protein